MLWQSNSRSSGELRKPRTKMSTPRRNSTGIRTDGKLNQSEMAPNRPCVAGVEPEISPVPEFNSTAVGMPLPSFCPLAIPT